MGFSEWRPVFGYDCHVVLFSAEEAPMRRAPLVGLALALAGAVIIAQQRRRRRATRSAS